MEVALAAMATTTSHRLPPQVAQADNHNFGPTTFSKHPISNNQIFQSHAIFGPQAAQQRAQMLLPWDNDRPREEEEEEEGDHSHRSKVQMARRTLIRPFSRI
jgi:hypothetical protein